MWDVSIIMELREMGSPLRMECMNHHHDHCSATPCTHRSRNTGTWEEKCLPIVTIFVRKIGTNYEQRINFMKRKSLAKQTKHRRITMNG
jgi:hypothetical protein